MQRKNDKQLASVWSACEQRGWNVTAPRQEVIETLVKAGKPLTAYEIIDELGAKPPTVYRALEFWVETGFVHKLDSKNAFVFCAETHDHADALFLVCSECENVEEIHDRKISNALETLAKHQHFHINRALTELHGTCSACCKGH